MLNAKAVVCSPNSKNRPLIDLEYTNTPVLLTNDVLDEIAVDPVPVKIEPDDICFLQLTSGSTASPKAVIVSHQCIAENAEAILNAALSVDADRDIVVSWLPLHHDMGLVGNVLAALISAVQVIYLPTKLFVKRPQAWMRCVDRYRGTITFGTSSSLGLVCKSAGESYPKGLDLSCLRVLGCGAEPIDRSVVDRFTTLHLAVGFRPEALMPCYGMAEATLGVTFGPRNRQPRFEHVERPTFEYHAQPGVTPDHIGLERLDVVSCGRTFAGHTIRILATDGTVLPDGKIGEICLRGPSVTLGYYNATAETKEKFRDEWLYTGDLGFVKDQELFVVGRTVETIFLNGRKYLSAVFEQTVEEVDGTVVRRSAAFSVRRPTREALVIVVEVKASTNDFFAFRVRETIMARFGLSADVVLVPPGWMPMTPSGKIKRHECKALYEQKLMASDVRLAKSHFNLANVAKQ